MLISYFGRNKTAQRHPRPFIPSVIQRAERGSSEMEFVSFASRLNKEKHDEGQHSVCVFVCVWRNKGMIGHRVQFLLSFSLLFFKR